MFFYLPYAQIYDMNASLILFPFDISNALININSLALTYSSNGQITQPPGFQWANLTNFEGNFGTPTSVSLQHLIFCSFLAFFFALYIETVWPGNLLKNFKKTKTVKVNMEFLKKFGFSCFLLIGDLVVDQNQL